MKIKNAFTFLSLMITISIISCNDDSVIEDNSILDYISYFSFDNHLIDETGYTATQEIIDSFFFVPGIKGKGLDINENSNSISFDKKTFRNGGSKLSISIWVNTTNSNLNTRHFIWCDDFTIFTNNEKTGLSISIPLTNSAKSEFTPGEWTHLVGTYDGNTIKCYINGVLKAETNHSGEISTPDRELQIRASSGWSGMIDEFYIYDKVLNQDEVVELYQL